MKKRYNPNMLIDAVKNTYPKLKLSKGWRDVRTTIGLGYVKRQAVDFLNALYDILGVDWIDTNLVFISPDVYDELKKYLHPYLHELLPSYKIELAWDEIEWEVTENGS